MRTKKSWKNFQTGKLRANFLIALSVIIILSSCGDDDSDTVANPGGSNVRIIEVDAAADEVTLQNFGDVDADISNYWFCIQRRYSMVSEANPSGDLTLSPNETITFSVSVSDAASDVSIYNTNSFGATSALEDFMQFNGSFTANGREDVAVAKGIWAAGEFVEGSSSFTYNGDGTQNGASQWSGGTASSNVKIVSVDAVNDRITLKNFGTGSQDLSEYWFCIQRNYIQLSEIAPTSGDLILEADESIEFTRPIDDAGSDVSIYSTNSFASADALVDFMQFNGSFTSNGREDVAVAKGIWAAGAFVEGINPFSFVGGGSDVGAPYWTDNANIRMVSINPETDEVTIRNFDTQERDISGYFFCTQAGVYPNFSETSDIEIISGDFVLSAGEEVTVRVLTSGGVVDNTGAIFLFSTNILGFNNDNPYVLRDFAQWGEANAFRVGNAVAAGRWDDGANFIDGLSPYTYNGDSDDVGASFWVTPAAVRIISIDPDTESVTIKNLGGTEVDISAFEFCLGPGNYNPLSNYTTIAGDLVLSADEDVTIDLTSSTVDVADLPASGALSLFVDASDFSSTSPDQLKDFVQWEAANGPRVGQAVTAGRWDDANNFVSGTAPFEYTGDFDDAGSDFWQ